MNDLLKPSLRQDLAGTPLYSAGSTFWVAFLGGPFAVVAYAGINSARMHRLWRDAPYYAIGLLAFLGVFATYALAPGALGLEPFAPGAGASPYPRLIIRGCGLLLWLGIYALHRPEHRAMQLLGASPPSPWKPAIACIVLGTLPLLALGTWVVAVSPAGAGG